MSAKLCHDRTVAMGKDMGKQFGGGGRWLRQSGAFRQSKSQISRSRLLRDGGNLYFRVAPSGARGWIFRFTVGGRTRDMGLGAYPQIGLAAHAKLPRLPQLVNRTSIRLKRGALRRQNAWPRRLRP